MIYGESIKKSDLAELNLKEGDAVKICVIPAGSTYLRTVDEGEYITVWYDNNTDFTMSIG